MKPKVLYAYKIVSVRFHTRVYIDFESSILPVHVFKSIRWPTVPSDTLLTSISVLSQWITEVWNVSQQFKIRTRNFL